jgi:cobalamin-dependent methionine synthase I
MNGTLHRYWGEITNEMALRTAAHALHEHMAEQYRPGHVSTMSPGSLSDWPLQEQRPLFALLGAPEQTIGVRLTASLLMVPMKSASGIGFPTEERFESCQLCPREDCPGRRAPYDKGLYERKYQPREN